MAKQIITTLVDDIDGTEADESVEFALDGTTYTIDLSEKNADKLRTALDPYISAGTRFGRTATSSGTFTRGAAGIRSRASTSPTGSGRELNQAIRAWAKEVGVKLADRGRIPTEVVEKYHAGQRYAQTLGNGDSQSNGSSGNGRAKKRTKAAAASFSG